MFCFNQNKPQFIIQIQHFFMFFKIVFNKEVHILNPKVQPSFSDLQVYIKQVFKHVPSKFQLSYLDEENDQITLANETDFKILKESAQKTVKIFIKQVNEDFYDQTQQVQLDDQVQEIGNKIQSLKLQQKPVPNLQEIKSTSEVSSSKISQAQIDDSVLEQKIRKMMPEVISKIKSELISQGRVQQPKESPKVQIKPKPVHPHITCDNCGKCPLEGVRYKCAVCADFDLCEQCESLNETHDHPFLKIKHPRQTPYKIIAIVDDEHNSFEINGQRANFPGLNQLIGHGLSHISNFFGQQHPHGHGHGFGNRGRKCPFNKKQAKEEKKEEKNTQAQKPKQESPKSNEYEKVGQKKVKRQMDEQSVPLINKEETQPIITEDKIVQITRQQKIMEAATYLKDILDIDYNRCYKFASKNEFYYKQELLQMYFSNPKLL